MNVIGIKQLYSRQGMRLMIREKRSKKFLLVSAITIKMAQSKKMTVESFLDGVNVTMSGTQVVIFKYKDIVN
jgi:hypothetical protein